VTCLPPPACLTDPGPVPGLGPVHRTRRVAVARAALDDKPDTAEPAALPPEQARQRLEQLPGIGPFSSAIVVVRALRHTDYLAGLGTELNTIVGGHAASGTWGRRKSLTRSRSHGRRADLVPAVHPLGQPPAHRSHTPGTLTSTWASTGRSSKRHAEGCSVMIVMTRANGRLGSQITGRSLMRVPAENLGATSESQAA